MKRKNGDGPVRHHLPQGLPMALRPNLRLQVSPETPRPANTHQTLSPPNRRFSTLRMPLPETPRTDFRTKDDLGTERPQGRVLEPTGPDGSPAGPQDVPGEGGSRSRGRFDEVQSAERFSSQSGLSVGFLSMFSKVTVCSCKKSTPSSTSASERRRRMT